MFGKYDENKKLIPAQLELVRLAIPRRVYTQSHIDYVAEVIIEVFNARDKIRGLQIVEEAAMLRHFTAKLKPKCESMGVWEYGSGSWHRLRLSPEP